MPVDPPVPAPSPAPAPAPASFAYLLQSTKVEVCRIDSGDTLVDCIDAGFVAPGFLKLRGMAISGSNAYLANDNLNDDSPITHCRIEATGTLTGCADSDATGVLAEPHGLTVHGSTLYIANVSGPIVRKCDIQTDGSLGTCSDANFPDALANTARDLRIVGTTAYVLHYGESKISKCEIVADGTLSGCVDAGATGLDSPKGFAISGSHMYVANEGPGEGAPGSVTRCTLADDGMLGNCADAGANVSSPNQIAIQGSAVYITNSSTDDSLTHCTAGSDGLLTGCTSVSGNGLYSIVVR